MYENNIGSNGWKKYLYTQETSSRSDDGELGMKASEEASEDDVASIMETVALNEAPNDENLLTDSSISEDEYFELYSDMRDLLSSIEEADLNNDSLISEDEIDAFLEKNGNIFEKYDVDMETIREEAYKKADDSSRVKDKATIIKLLDTIGDSSKHKIIEQLGGLHEIQYIELNEDGSLKIVSDFNSATVFTSGKYDFSYDTPERTGNTLYDEQNRPLNNTYVDHTDNDAVISENYTYNEDNSYIMTVENSNIPNEQKILSFNSNNEVVSVDNMDMKTGEITNEFLSSSADLSSGNIFAGGLSSESSYDDDELSSLVSQRNEVQEDLANQQAALETTQSEKADELGAIDSEIQSGEADLNSANADVETASQAVDTAQGQVDDAQGRVEASQEQADAKQSELSDATSQAQEAQSQQQAAAGDNQAKAQAQTEAQNDNTTAQNDLNNAVDNTQSAQTGADSAANKLDSASQAAKTAINVRNQKKADVDKAQKAYDNAQTAQNDSDKSLWSKIKSAISSAFNALKNAIAGLDEAEKEAKAKEKEEEKARVVNEEAQEALQQRKEEQDKAQSVADAAYIVLMRANDEKSVSDQEYADALMNLADAMQTQENEKAEYDSALQRLMEDNNYLVDEEGNLRDAENNLVSSQEIVANLENMVCGLNKTRENKETSYNNVLEATANAIENKESQLESLNTQISDLISDLQTKIDEEKKNIALDEQMMATLAAEKGELNAAKDSCGLVDDIAGLFGKGYADDTKDYEKKRELLEQALTSNDPNKRAEAYKALYGDEVVAINESGQVVDPSSITDEDSETYLFKTLSELETDEVAAQMSYDAQAAVESQQMYQMIDSGVFCYDGQTVSTDDIFDFLNAEVNQMEKDAEDAFNQQGIISKGLGFVNNFTSFGTSKKEVQAQVAQYRAMVEKLKNCNDPAQFAAAYKQITGSNLDAGSVLKMLAYNDLSDDSSSNTSGNTSADSNTSASSYAGEQLDITDDVNKIKDAAKNDKSKLSNVKNTKAAESIQDYVDTQNTIKTTAIAIGATVLATAAVAATPLTGGASLLAVGAVAGALTTGLNAVDSVYNSDEDSTLEFNYSLKDAGKDFAIGFVSGVSNEVANIAGAKAVSFVGNKMFGSAAVSVAKSAGSSIPTTFNQALAQSAKKLGTELIGNAVDGYVDGFISNAADYVANRGDSEFSMSDMLKQANQGGMAGVVMGSAMTLGAKIISAPINGVKNIKFEADINKALREGSSGNLLSDVIANQADDFLTDAGKINHWSVNQLRNNVEDASKAIRQALSDVKIPDNDMAEILSKVSPEKMPYLSDAINAIKMNGINELSTKEQILSFADSLDDIKVNPVDGKVRNLVLKSETGELDIKLDSNGALDNMVKTNPDGTRVKIEKSADGQFILTKLDPDITNVNYSDDIVDDIPRLSDPTSGTRAYITDGITDDIAEQVDDVLDVAAKQADDVLDVAVEQVDDVLDVAAKQADDVLDVAAEQADNALSIQPKQFDNAKILTKSNKQIQLDPNESYLADPNAKIKIGNTYFQLSDMDNLENGTYIIGRGNGADIVIPDSNVSRNHLEVTKTDKGYYIRDLNSTNGTMYNALQNRPELNKYQVNRTAGTMNEVDFANHLSYQGYSLGEKKIWNSYIVDDFHSAWKMHIYSDNVEDYQKMAEVILPYLRDVNVNHKCLGSNQPIAVQASNIQKGKAFTIYPSSKEQMAQIAKDLDYIIRNNSLDISSSSIVGDRNLGDSGRLFYRYEYKSKNQANVRINIGDGEVINPDNVYINFKNGYYDAYLHQLYDSNEGRVRLTGKGSYLALDMTSKDDPFFYFDPSDPNSRIE